MLRWAANLDPHPDRVMEACNRLYLIGRMGKPEEVARVIVFLASFMTGSAVMVKGGLLVPVGGHGFSGVGNGREGSVRLPNWNRIRAAKEEA